MGLVERLRCSGVFLLFRDDANLILCASWPGGFKANPEIRLSTEEREILLRWMRNSKTEQRMVERARAILLAASGLRACKKISITS
jgi:hypothetical protein